MTEWINPQYELTRSTFLEIVRDRIYHTNFRNSERMGGSCWSDPSNKHFDQKGRIKFYVGLNRNDPIDVQATSLVHESVHIGLSEEFWRQVQDASNFTEMKDGEELFVQEKTTIFLERHGRLAQGAINYLKVKNGVGVQLPLKLV